MGDVREYDLDTDLTPGTPRVDYPTGDDPIVSGDRSVPSEPSTPPDYALPLVVRPVRESVDVRWSGVSVTVDENGARLLAARRNRRLVKITNNNAAGGNTVYVSANESFLAGYGYPIPPGTTEEWAHEGAVYARCLATQTAVVGVSEEWEHFE